MPYSISNKSASYQRIKNNLAGFFPNKYHADRILLLEAQIGEPLAEPLTATKETYQSALKEYKSLKAAV